MYQEDQTQLGQKQERLDSILKKYKSLGVAFSGGVDSTLLLAAAQRQLGDKVVAFTAESPVNPNGEKEAAVEIALALGVRHVLFSSHEMDDPEFRGNPIDRCYHCKTDLFKTMWAEAKALGIESLAHGANMDDLSDYRPGFKAAQEMGVDAPLNEAGLTKADIRGLAKRLRLSNWDRPAMACLASRIPYGTPIDTATLSRIDKAERFIRGLGVAFCRVRAHGSVARIEIDPLDLVRFVQSGTRQELVKKLRELGFAHIALDLEGYSSGKMNRDLALE
jgi:pyridinium-3,5-biscarboxylic acid mononucleotide sulfurtransferase